MHALKEPKWLNKYHGQHFICFKLIDDYIFLSLHKQVFIFCFKLNRIGLVSLTYAV